MEIRLALDTFGKCFEYDIDDENEYVEFVTDIKKYYESLNLADIEDAIYQDVNSYLLKDFISNHFLKVYLDKNSIEFTITSRNYDWHRIMVEFLFQKFNSIGSMPSHIIIKSEPKNKILFNGSAFDLLEDFDKTEYFESKTEDMKPSELQKLFKDSFGDYYCAYK